MTSVDQLLNPVLCGARGIVEGGEMNSLGGEGVGEIKELDRFIGDDEFDAFAVRGSNLSSEKHEERNVLLRVH